MTDCFVITDREKVPRVGTAVPLAMPEVDALPGSARGSQPGSARGEQGSSGSQSGYPDLLLLESWMSEMAERVLVNKQQEVFSKVMFDRSLLSYTMDAKHGETEVHNMWSTKEHGLSSLGCTREQLYARHLSSEAVEKLYRALYIYSVGLPTAVKQITEHAAKKEPASATDEGDGQGLPVLALSSFLHLFMEVLKSTHGDSIATQVEDNFVAGALSISRLFPRPIVSRFCVLARFETFGPSFVLSFRLIFGQTVAQECTRRCRRILPRSVLISRAPSFRLKITGKRGSILFEFSLHGPHFSCNFLTKSRSNGRCVESRARFTAATYGRCAGRVE